MQVLFAKTSSTNLLSTVSAIPKSLQVELGTDVARLGVAKVLGGGDRIDTSHFG